MVQEIDVWRCAWLMVQQYGEEAASFAAMRADALEATGDLDGFATWQRIRRAIEGMQQIDSGKRPVH